MIAFLIVAEVPLGIIALEIVLSKGRCGVACGVKAILCIGAFDTRDGLRHDAEGAIGELFDAPELFIGSSIGWNGGHLLIGCSGEGALSAFDGDLEVRIAEIATCQDGTYSRRCGRECHPEAKCLSPRLKSGWQWAWQAAASAHG